MSRLWRCQSALSLRNQNSNLVERNSHAVESRCSKLVPPNQQNIRQFCSSEMFGLSPGSGCMRRFSLPPVSCQLAAAASQPVLTSRSLFVESHNMARVNLTQSSHFHTTCCQSSQLPVNPRDGQVSDKMKTAAEATSGMGENCESVNINAKDKSTVDQTNRRNFSSTHFKGIRGRNPSYRYRRRPPGNTTVLLERFIKQATLDCSLVAKAPFSLSCYGCHFDSENKANVERNREVELDRDQFLREERQRRREEHESRLEAKFTEPHSTIRPMNLEETMKITDFSELEKRLLDESDVTNMKGPSSKVDFTETEKQILDQLSAVEAETFVEKPHTPHRSPIHFKLFGKPHLRVDSYSVIRASGKNSSHLYISDVTSIEEAIHLLQSTENGYRTEDKKYRLHGAYAETGQFTIFTPKPLSLVEASEYMSRGQYREDIASFLKVYTPLHIVDDPENFLKGTFLCPILMSKIVMETERFGHIALNGKLLDQLETVLLTTEYGNIFIRDVWASMIRMSSKHGDIVCYGTVESSISAHLDGEGHFVASIVVSPRITVSTKSGDINVWGDCFADAAEFATISGNIKIRKLYGCGKIVVADRGTVSVNVVEGSLAAGVKSGSVYATISKLLEDSFIHLESGDVTLIIPEKYSFRLTITARHTNISPFLLNAGELYINREGDECFDSGLSIRRDEPVPRLYVNCYNGKVTVKVSEHEFSSGNAQKTPANSGYDSS